MRPRNIGGSSSWVVVVAYLETCSFEVAGFLGKLLFWASQVFPDTIWSGNALSIWTGVWRIFRFNYLPVSNFCNATTYRHNGNSILCIVPFCFFTAGNRFPSTRFSSTQMNLTNYTTVWWLYQISLTSTSISFRSKHFWNRTLGGNICGLSPDCWVSSTRGLSPPASIDTTHQYQAYQKVLTGHPTGGKDPKKNAEQSWFSRCLY